MHLLFSEVTHPAGFVAAVLADKGSRDTGVNAIESLMDKKGKFDYILLETTGLADPGNLAPLFWMDDGLGSTIYLDGIVTLVDAKNILRSLDDAAGKVDDHKESDGHGHGPVMTTAHVQISHADVVVINKADLVDDEQLQRVRARIESINGLAKIHVTKQSVIPRLEGFLLDLHAYDNVEELDRAAKGHSHLDPASRPTQGHCRCCVWANDWQSISTLSIPLGMLDDGQVEKVDAWLRSVLWDNKLPGDSDAHTAQFEIHRLKGRIAMPGGQVKVIQGVRELFEIFSPPEGSGGDPPSTSKVVLIGRHLQDFDFQGSLAAAVGG